MHRLRLEGEGELHRCDEANTVSLSWASILQDPNTHDKDLFAGTAIVFWDILFEHISIFTLVFFSHNLRKHIQKRNTGAQGMDHHT